MSPKPDFTAAIAECVREAYGLDARRIDLIAGRAHAEAKVYRVRGDDGSYFLKLTPHPRGTPSPLARYLADSGISEILAPLRARDGQLFARMADWQATLYLFVEGENAFQRPLNEDQWVALGRVLRAIHDVTLPASFSDLVRRETYSNAWRSKATRYLTAVSSRYPDDSVARDFTGFLTSKSAEITALVEHARQLAGTLRRKGLTPVPCHGDLHAGNVLSDGLRSLTIVDWDDPVLAPRERDLMFVGAGIGGVWNRDDESAAFYRGYGAVEVDGEALAYYRCERFVEDVVTFYDRLLLRGDDPGDREAMFRKFITAFDPDNVVEIAERTVAVLSTTRSRSRPRTRGLR